MLALWFGVGRAAVRLLFALPVAPVRRGMRPSLGYRTTPRSGVRNSGWAQGADGYGGSRAA